MKRQKLNQSLQVYFISYIPFIGVVIKKKNRKTKFKLRCPRYLYTLKIDDETKAKKITNSIPSSKFLA